MQQLHSTGTIQCHGGHMCHDMQSSLPYLSICILGGWCWECMWLDCQGQETRLRYCQGKVLSIASSLTIIGVRIRLHMTWRHCNLHTLMSKKGCQHCTGQPTSQSSGWNAKPVWLGLKFFAPPPCFQPHKHFSTGKS